MFIPKQLATGDIDIVHSSISPHGI